MNDADKSNETTREKLHRTADAIADASDDAPAMADVIEDAMSDAMHGAAEPLLADAFAACALIGTECRGQDPDAVAARCYDVSKAMLKRRAELLAPEAPPERVWPDAVE